MRTGEKCKFTVGKDIRFGNLKLKGNHRYTGYAWDKEGTLVCYRNVLLKAKTIEPIQKPAVKKEKAPTASDYKNFSDLCFEVAIRYRDNWTSVISGKKFEEGDWNGLQAGHGVSRQHWATRHNPYNCHAITSGENFHMSIGTTTIIAKYWAYVTQKYGEKVVDELVNNNESPKLTIAYLKEDCFKCRDFLYFTLLEYAIKNNKRIDPEEVIKWRCEKFPKAKATGVLKVLKMITEGQI